MKIGNQLFKIANDKDGRAFISTIRNLIRGTDYKLRLRGRKPDREHPMYWRRGKDTPLAACKEIAVYLQVKHKNSVYSLTSASLKNMFYYSDLYYELSNKFALLQDEQSLFIKFCLDKAPEVVLKYKMLKNGGKI